MRGKAFIIIALLVFGFSCKNKITTTQETKEKVVVVSPAKALIIKMVQKAGTMQKFARAKRC